jgi:ABC-2 type transport system permease protein
VNALAIGGDRTVLELKMYFREKEAVFFSFAFPILMLAMFSVIFGDQFGKGDTAGVSAARFFLPGMAAAGVMLTSFQSMAMSVAAERDDGTLKRLRSTPMPPLSYFLGKVGLVAGTSLAQFVLLIGLARLAFSVPLPTGAGWVAFLWVFLLGVACGTVLGIAYSSLANSARSMGAIVIAPTLILQFISGVYFAFTDLPDWLKQVASLFPLKWIAQGMRSAFYPASWQTMEMAGTWEHGRTALVLGLWILAGLVLCARTFRWTGRGTT